MKKHERDRRGNRRFGAYFSKKTFPEPRGGCIMGKEKNAYFIWRLPMNETWRFQIGQCLGVGFDGPVIPEEYKELVRKYKIGNVIFFRRNVESFEQIRALCRDLTGLIRGETGLPPFILAGEEGGSVSRLGHIAGFTPCPMAMGATGDPENARIIGRWMGKAMRAVGINMDSGPVLDCFSNPDNAVIGTRSFGSDPETASAFGTAFLTGLREAGVMGCGKHFPGHGDTSVDSHLAMPLVDKTEAEFRKTELPSFAAAIRAGIEAVMTAHVVLPAVDPERQPATVSKKILTGLLREEMGFQGVVISDGMEMKAVMDLYGIEEATLRAINAGCDMALICHSAQQASDTAEYLMRALEDGRLKPETLEDRVRRLTALKRKIQPPMGDYADFRCEEKLADCRRIMERSIRLFGAPEGRPLPALGADTLFAGVPPRAASIAGDAGPLNAAEYMAKALGGVYGGLTADDEALKKARCFVAFLGTHPDADKVRQAVCRAAELGVPTVAVSLYTPRSLFDLPESVWKICAWQYDALSLGALEAYFRRVGETEKKP